MAITKDTIISHKTVDEHGIVHILRAHRIMENGQEIAPRTIERVTLEPGTDLKEHPKEVATFAQSAWTQDVRAAWKAKRAQGLRELQKHMRRTSPPPTPPKALVPAPVPKAKTTRKSKS